MLLLLKGHVTGESVTGLEGSHDGQWCLEFSEKRGGFGQKSFDVRRGQCGAGRDMSAVGRDFVGERNPPIHLIWVRAAYMGDRRFPDDLFGLNFPGIQKSVKCSRASTFN